MTRQKGQAAEIRRRTFRRRELVAAAKSAGLSPDRVESYDSRADVLCAKSFSSFEGQSYALRLALFRGVLSEALPKRQF